MNNEQGPHASELHGLIEVKLSALFLELENADWSMVEIASAIRDVLKAKWLDEVEAQQRARAAFPDNFVSDGNEG